MKPVTDRAAAFAADGPDWAGRPARGRVSSQRWLSWLALLLATVAVILGALALLRSPSPASSASQAPTTLPAPTELAQEPAAGDDVCSVAVGAAQAIARDRRPFLEAPPQFDDPITAAALTRAQASALVELEAMQAAVGPSTPPQLADAIAAYRRGVLDMLDADTRRLPAAVSNAASRRTAAAAETITTLCKGE